MKRQLVLPSLFLLWACSVTSAADTTPAQTSSQAHQWRTEHRLVDLHQHINCSTQHLTRAVGIMDSVGIGIAVNLSGGTVTGSNGAPSEFERNKAMADALFPRRFLHYMNLDFRGWGNPDFADRAVQQVEAGHKLGAAGLKEYKRLGLYLRDREGRLIKIDDPKLDPVWSRCGELKMPVSIHVADPKAFWLPYNAANERWKELKDHRSWWFGDTNLYPPRMELLEALNRVIARHPKTTFVCVHFANNAEDLEWVDRSLQRYPNMMADLAARIPEIGRHDPEKVRQLFIKHQDRIFFATDFQVYDRLILGSSGNEPPPSDADARTFFAKHWRWLETNDRNFAHMTPIQGDWTINAIGLPDEVLRKIYFDNACRILAGSLPPAVIKAAHIKKDFDLTGSATNASWQQAESARLEYESRTYTARPELSTTVRALWSDRFLYLSYRCPYTEITAFDFPQPGKERFGLWDRDVVEAFIGSDDKVIGRYAEFEVAPTNEKLDVILDPPRKDFEWSSGFESAVKVDASRKLWTAEMRIPLSALAKAKPKPGDRWRLNLYRCDYANKAFLAWSPTFTGTFHTPEKFGQLEFTE